MTSTTPSVTLTTELFTAVVAAAVRAPSLHNSQPWRFRSRDGCVEVLTDRDRALPVSDPSGWAARIACGAATFNTRLALANLLGPADVRLRPDPDEPQLMARLCPGPRRRPPTPVEVALYAAVPRRRSNRRPFADVPVPPEVRTRLVDAARTEGAWLELLVGPGPLAAVAELTRAAERVLGRNPEYQGELAAWTRADPDSTDGVPLHVGGPSPQPHDLLAMRDFGGPDRAPGRDFEAEPLLAVLGTAGNSPVDQLVAGQALQRVLLTITDSGLSASMLSQPIEVASAREQLRLGLGRYGTPQMVLRVGYGQPGTVTPRRPVSEVIDPPGPMSRT